VSVYPIRCRCGRIAGTIDGRAPVNRGVCYCRDCQAFAHFLGRETDILDARGGTDIVQTSPAALSFSAGVTSLACMRLTPRGLLRWYSRCCNTAIGNTPADYRFSFVGLVWDCLGAPDASHLDVAFGPVRAHVHTGSARGTPTPRADGQLRMALRLLPALLRNRLSGRYRSTPFFDAATGAPVVAPYVLNHDEREALLGRVDG
jgi:hypothetical protein